MLTLNVVDAPIPVASSAGAVAAITGGWFGLGTAVTVTAAEVVLVAHVVGGLGGQPVGTERRGRPSQGVGARGVFAELGGAVEELDLGDRAVRIAGRGGQVGGAGE